MFFCQILQLSLLGLIFIIHSCHKWRKHPADMSPEEFPDEWYCAMNTWDTFFATCNAPEEEEAPSDSEEEH